MWSERHHRVGSLVAVGSSAQLRGSVHPGPHHDQRGQNRVVRGRATRFVAWRVPLPADVAAVAEHRHRPDMLDAHRTLGLLGRQLWSLVTRTDMRTRLLVGFHDAEPGRTVSSGAGCYDVAVRFHLGNATTDGEPCVRYPHRSSESTDVWTLGTATGTELCAALHGAAAHDRNATGTVPAGADRHRFTVRYDERHADAHRVADVREPRRSVEPSDVLTVGRTSRSILRATVCRAARAIAVVRCIGRVSTGSDRLAHVAVRASARRLVLDARRTRRVGRVDADGRDAQRRRHMRTSHADVRRTVTVDSDAVRTAHGKRSVSGRAIGCAHLALDAVARGVVSEPDGSRVVDTVGRYDVSVQRSEYVRDATAARVLVASASCATGVSGRFVATRLLDSRDVSCLDVQPVGAVSHAAASAAKHLPVLQRERINPLHEYRAAAPDGWTARARRSVRGRVRRIDLRYERAVRVHNAERLVHRMVRHQRRTGCVRMRTKWLGYEPSVRPDRKLWAKLRRDGDSAAHPEQHNANLRLLIPMRDPPLRLNGLPGTRAPEDAGAANFVAHTCLVGHGCFIEALLRVASGRKE